MQRRRGDADTWPPRDDDRLLAPLFFAHFLRLRYYLSPPTRKAFAWVSNRVDQYTVRNSKCPPVVTKAVKVVRELVSPLSLSCLLACLRFWPRREEGFRGEGGFFMLDARGWDWLRGAATCFGNWPRLAGPGRVAGPTPAGIDKPLHVRRGRINQPSYSFKSRKRLTGSPSAPLSPDHPVL